MRHQGAVEMKEGSFEGLIESLDFTDNWTVGTPSTRLSGGETVTASTPLPTEVPERIDLSQVPANILRSNVVEALVSQNEDLMSRLGVVLRRTALLEDKLSDTRLECEQFRAKYENLNDQLLVLKEKSRALASRKDRDESEFGSLKEQIKLLEIRYAELYGAAETKEANLLKTFEQQSKSYRRLVKYRARVRSAVESLKKSAREKWQAEVNLAKSEASQENLRQHLAESADYIANLSKEHKQAIATLTAQNETRISQIRAQLVEALSQNERLSERAYGYDQLLQDKMQLENDIVLRERREEEIRIQTTAEITDLQKSLTRYRNETKDLAVQLEKATAELAVATDSLNATRLAKNALEEQVENLQILWRENQSQIEKVNEKNRSLQKLNQELSVAINQYRREIRSLKEAADTQVLQNLDGGSGYVAGVTGLGNNATFVPSAGAATPQNAASNYSTPELLQKIDDVFVDLHTNSKL
jgi:chromosome segregation ATPase